MCCYFALHAILIYPVILKNILNLANSANFWKQVYFYAKKEKNHTNFCLKFSSVCLSYYMNWHIMENLYTTISSKSKTLITMHINYLNYLLVWVPHCIYVRKGVFVRVILEVCYIMCVLQHIVDQNSVKRKVEINDLLWSLYRVSLFCLSNADLFPCIQNILKSRKKSNPIEK